MNNSSDTNIFDFDGDEFKAATKESIPWGQLVNPKLTRNGMTECGLAVKIDQAEAAKFIPNEEWNCATIEMGQKKEKNKFLITKTPRIIILGQGPIEYENREDGEFLGVLPYETYKANPLLFKPLRRYLLVFCNKQKTFLQETPIRFTLKGVPGAQFAEAYDKRKPAPTGFKTEVEAAYGAFKEKRPEPKSSLFHAHAIFQPVLEELEAGKPPNTAWVCGIKSYTIPKADGSTIRDFLIAPNTHESELIHHWMKEYEDFSLPRLPRSQQQPAAPAKNNDYDYGELDEALF